MIHISQVVIERSANSLLMEMPTVERAMCEDGLLENHVYIPLGQIDLEEADETIRDELELLQRIEKVPESLQSEGFSAIEDEIAEDFGPFGTFDIGVTGLIQALTATGCVTITSCNGGVFGDGNNHDANYPCIEFHAPASLLHLLLDCADKIDMGLVNVSNGMLQVYADDIRKFNSLARLLVDTRMGRI